MPELEPLEQIYTDIEREPAFDRLRQSGNELVPGDGSQWPDTFVIGEAPGAQEAARGKPFVGPAGAVLRQLIGVAGLDVADCWLTNAIKYRPPRNRKPTQIEIKASIPYVVREWQALGSPRLIIPVGSTALWAVRGARASILEYAGRPYRYRIGRTVVANVYPMIHPSFGLRKPAARPLMERDWADLGRWIKANLGGGR